MNPHIQALSNVLASLDAQLSRAGISMEMANEDFRAHHAALTAAIALMRGQSWIMASDRLPERLEGRDCSADVLVSDGKRVWIHCAYFDWKAMDKDYLGDTPYTPRLGSGADRWMPLPQPKDPADEQ